MSRFLDKLNGKQTDRPPMWFMRQAGRVLPSYMALREKHSFKEMMETPKLASEVTLLPVNDLGVDAAILFSDILVIPEALGMHLEFTQTGPRFDAPLCSKDAPLKDLKYNDDRLSHVYGAIEQILKDKPEDVPLIGFCGGPLTVLCYMWEGFGTNHEFPQTVDLVFRDEKLLGDLVDAITGASIHYAKNQVKAGIQAFQLFETWSGLIPWQHYRDLFLPAAKKIIEAVKAEGVPVIFFPRMAGTGLLDVAELPVNGVSIDWQTPFASARKMLGDKIIMQGNLDPRALLNDNFDAPKAVAYYADYYKKDPNFIFNLGHGFLPKIPFKNAKALVDAVRAADWG